MSLLKKREIILLGIFALVFYGFFRLFGLVSGGFASGVYAFFITLLFMCLAEVVYVLLMG